jgi:hypothetical protein
MKRIEKQELLDSFMDWLDPKWNSSFNPKLMYCGVPHTTGDWLNSRYQLVDLFLKDKHVNTFPRGVQKRNETTYQ